MRKCTEKQQSFVMHFTSFCFVQFFFLIEFVRVQWWIRQFLIQSHFFRSFRNKSFPFSWNTNEKKKVWIFLVCNKKSFCHAFPVGVGVAVVGVTAHTHTFVCMKNIILKNCLNYAIFECKQMLKHSNNLPSMSR